MKLWLVRHAAPLVEPGVCYGRTDMPAGERETQEAAQYLARQLPPSIGLVGSPLKRCMQLATTLCVLRPDLSSRPDTRLAEMDFGAWEGRRWDAIGEEALRAWTDDFASHRPGGGESVDEFMARVAAAYGEAHAAGQDTAWITHAGVIRAVSLIAQGQLTVRHASDWPELAPSFGAWRIVEL